MEEKAWEHFMMSGSVYDYLEYRGVLCEGEIRSEKKQEKDWDGRNSSDRYGVSRNADRRL